MIKCKKCNALNEFDRVLCLSCGEKLDFNDPSLIENTIHDIKETKYTNNRANVTLKNDSFIANIIYILFIFIIFISIFFMFSAANVPSLKLSPIAANSLNEKLINLVSDNPSGYLLLSTDEINIYIERVLAKTREEITKKNPSFLKLDRIIFSIINSKAHLFIIFNVFKRPIIIKLIGEIENKEQKIYMSVSKTFIGELIIPKTSINWVLKNVIDVLSSKNLFKLPDSISSIKTDKEKLIIYTKNTSSKDSQKTDLLNDYNIKTPDDVLLIQAAETYYNQSDYRLALKCFTLIKMKYPHSPFKSQALKHIKLCQDKL